MLGAVSHPWCPFCRAEAGPDCPNTAITRRHARRRENQQWRQELNHITLIPHPPNGGYRLIS